MKRISVALSACALSACAIGEVEDEEVTTVERRIAPLESTMAIDGSCNSTNLISNWLEVQPGQFYISYEITDLTAKSDPIFLSYTVGSDVTTSTETTGAPNTLIKGQHRFFMHTLLQDENGNTLLEDTTRVRLPCTL